MRKFYLPPRHITDLSPSADDIAAANVNISSIRGAKDIDMTNASDDTSQHTEGGDNFELTVEQALKEYYEYVNSRNK